MREQAKQKACAGSGKWALTAIFAVAAALPIATGVLSLLLCAIPEYASAGTLGGGASLFATTDAIGAGAQGVISITLRAALGVGAGLCASQ